MGTGWAQEVGAEQGGRPSTWLPYEPAQSTSSCSEKERSFPVAIWYAPSVDPVVEKAQHEPHWPWFFTGVTAPLATQSTESARLDSSRIGVGLGFLRSAR